MSDTETTTTRAPDAPHPLRPPILALLGLAQLMLILDITVGAIALPDMGAELDLGRAALTWLVSGYALTFGSLMLLGGRAADLFGPKQVVLTGLAVFTAASLAAALATVAPHEAGVTSGIVSTFHEFGASAGAAAVSSAAATSIAARAGAQSTSGFDDAFLVATSIAAVSAFIVRWLIPAKQQ